MVPLPRNRSRRRGVGGRLNNSDAGSRLAADGDGAGLGPRARTVGLLRALARSRLFAYGSLLALQAKVTWGIWRFKDLSAGDTSSYFAGASRWAESLQTDPVWSPLYLIFYGSLQWLSSDPFLVTIAHRLIVLAALDVLVLALLRRLMPEGLAWLLAAWFVVLPINFDSLYEVHLFAAIPTLAAAVVAARYQGVGGRAAALGILVATTLLVRNELAVASGLWAGYCLWVDGIYGGRQAPARRRLAAYALAFGLVAAAGLAVAGRSGHDLRTNRARLRAKHTLNLCQIYAFGYAQRHPEWQQSPWTECHQLMERDFGAREPTLGEALRANPRALLVHAGWNAALIPAGIQLQLFGSISGRGNPDYAPVRAHSTTATVLTVLVATLVLIGGARLWRGRWGWCREWLRARAQAWTLLGCLAATSVVVMLMQRPRPSYLFVQSVTLLAAIGMAALVLAGGAARWNANLSPLVPLVAVLLLLLVPPYYGPETLQAFGQRGQPLRQAVERLAPWRRQFAGAEHRLLALRFPHELCSYLGRGQPCGGIGLGELANGGSPGRWNLETIEERGIDWIYLEEAAVANPEGRSLAQDLARLPRWKRLAPPEGAASWALFKRVEAR